MFLLPAKWLEENPPAHYDLAATPDEELPEKLLGYLAHYGEYRKTGQTDYFEYDATVNSIVIPSWYCAYHRNGKLVFLSKDYMVCVCTHDKDYKLDELIYLEIFQRVSKSERQTWVKRCPNYGIRI